MEYVLLSDRLRDIDVLSRLLGRDILYDIEVTYISKNDLGNLDVDIRNSFVKLKITDEDLEVLDTYYDCPTSHRRVLVYIDNSYLAWIYIKNKSLIAVESRKVWQ